MAKRKRAPRETAEPVSRSTPSKKRREDAREETIPSDSAVAETIQVVTGSYDQVLHGLTASITHDDRVSFADTFLFNAHTSIIRCVAVSPPSKPVPGQAQKVLLASGSTDERINIYNLSAHPPSRKQLDAFAKVAPRPISENPRNRELGTLLHHASTITALRFPTRSKLLSASEDSNIAVTRTCDWSVLSTIKAPIPKAHGRPSGDTAPMGSMPSGVNDFAVHPSMKLMISVSKGERCMRLWNLVTGKKAGVLSFAKEMLNEIGESRHSTGEGRKVVWGSADGADEFAVGFDRDVIIFGMDSVPKCRLMSQARIKLHQFSYFVIDEAGGISRLACSTEDGRIIFSSTQASDLSPPTNGDGIKSAAQLSSAKPICYVGGQRDQVEGRIKDFAILRSGTVSGSFHVIGGSSDGKVLVWRLQKADLLESKGQGREPRPAGKLLGLYETLNRITCMTAFTMIPRPDGVRIAMTREERKTEMVGEMARTGRRTRATMTANKEK